MKLSTSLVPVKKITSLAKKADFNAQNVEKLALQILNAEGIISPLILRRTSLESYEIIDGDFEYFAALRAKDINPRKGELISAFILDSDDPEKSSAIEAQVELLRKSESVSKIPPESQTVVVNDVSPYVIFRLQEIEKAINKMVRIESLDEIPNKIQRETNNTSDEIITRLERIEKSIDIFPTDDFINKIGNILEKIIKDTLTELYKKKLDDNEPNLPEIIESPAPVNLKSATRDEIFDRLSYLSTKNIQGFGAVDSDKSSDIIFNAIKSNWKDLKPITKLRCGIGSTKISTLNTVFTL